MSADDRSRRIVVAGDVTIDWNLARTPVCERNVWQWNAEDETCVYRQVGGASLLADLIEAVVTDLGQTCLVQRHFSAPPTHASPADSAFPQSWAIWSLFAYEMSKRQGNHMVWRVKEFLGLDRPRRRELHPPAPTVEWDEVIARILVLDDADLGFRENRQLWPAALLGADQQEQLPEWILLK